MSEYVEVMGVYTDEVLGSTDIKDWLDDAADFSAEGTDRIVVEMVSYDANGKIIYMTDFSLTPAQARAMFFAIAGAHQ